MNDKCDCGSCNLVFAENIGFDIWPGGEEKQHIQQCDDCKKVRFVVDVLDWDKNDSKWERHFGKWEDKSTNPFAIY